MARRPFGSVPSPLPEPLHVAAARETTLPPSAGRIFPVSEGHVCRSVGSEAWSEAPTPRVQGENRVAPPSNVVARMLLNNGSMKIDGRSNQETEAGTGTDSASEGTSNWISRWIPEEEAGFRGNLRFLTPPKPGSESALHLSRRPMQHRPATRGMAIAVLLNYARSERTMPSTPGRRRHGWFVPVVMLAMISCLAYVAAVQSVQAFQSAWESTDTRLQEGKARNQIEAWAQTSPSQIR